MNTKVFLITLLLLPGLAQAQSVFAGKEAQDFFQIYQRCCIQTPGSMQEFRLFKDGTVLHGYIKMGGISTKTHINLVDVAQSIATTTRSLFSIPADYEWKVREGGFVERRAVEDLGGGMRNVIMDLMVDAIPLEKGYIEIMVDDQGRLRTMTISIPRLRPEIVSAVRGPLKTPTEVTATIQANANQLPMNNEFMITPNAPLRFHHFRKVAIATEPYVVYKTQVNVAAYTVNAKTGAIMVRGSMVKR